jgi:hypothetical protein
VQVGLGTQDPTYDGVFRQSLSLLAFVAGNVAPASSARQASGHRSDTSAPCTESDPVNCRRP